MEEEIFVDIKGYEGLYQISNFGNVKSLNYKHTKQGRRLKLRKDIGGYLYVNLYKNGAKKTCKVHRLVAIAFIENPNNLPQVNHIDENKENNFFKNLEWCDAKYNINYGTGIQRRVKNTNYQTIVAKIDWKVVAKKVVEKLKNRQDLSRQVYQYSKDLKLIKIWESTMECKRKGFSQGNISECCNGKRKSHKGFIWSYIEILKDE